MRASFSRMPHLNPMPRRPGQTFSRKMRILLALSVAGCSAGGDPLPGGPVVVLPGGGTPSPTPTPTPTSTPAGPNYGAVSNMPDGFNAAFYAARNPDVVAAKMDMFEHYKWWGKAEGRAPYEGWKAGDLVVAGGVSGEPASIPSNFNVDDWLVPSWGSGKIADTGRPDDVGAFRFICNPSHNAYNDPIIYPGKKNASHLHTFFGNTKADENSTYESLRKTGDSTCNNALNRSAYWIPAMMTPAGKVVMPDFISIYYKRRPSDDPECLKKALRGCVGLPRGLRYVFGYNMNNPVASNGFHINCQGPGAVSGHFPNIPEAARNCPSGAQIGAIIGAPDCWDGKNLDSPDHRSHMAYQSYGNWGYAKCPSTHPYMIPTFTLGAWYTTDDTLDRSGSTAPDTRTWHFSSDRMAGMPWQTPGSTFHADWFGAWDDGVMKMWTEACIDKLLSCSGGDLGNGKQLKMYDGFQWTANPRLVDAPRI